MFRRIPRMRQANSGIVPFTIDFTTTMAPNLAVSTHELTALGSIRLQDINRLAQRTSLEWPSLIPYGIVL